MYSNIIMVVIKNDAMKAILKSRGVKGYSSQTKEGLVKMIEESGGFPSSAPPSSPTSPEPPKAKRTKKVKVVEEAVDVSGCVVEVEEAKVEEPVVEVKVKKTRKARPKPIEKFDDEKS